MVSDSLQSPAGATMGASGRPMRNVGKYRRTIWPAWPVIRYVQIVSGGYQCIGDRKKPCVAQKKKTNKQKKIKLSGFETTPIHKTLKNEQAMSALENKNESIYFLSSTYYLTALSLLLNYP